MVYPHWPTGIGHPLGYAGVDKSFPAPCSDDITSEQPEMISTPLSSNIQLEKKMNYTSPHNILLWVGVNNTVICTT